MLRVLLVFGLGCASVVAHAALSAEAIEKMSPAQIEAALPGEHPASYYEYATRLFSAGRKDDAVVWFYIGQLRYRLHLLATPDLDPSGDPALFASLNATVGQTINEYAGGSVRGWVAAIETALKWDQEHPNGFTSKAKFKSEYDSIRGGLQKMKHGLENDAVKIREQRTANGLENRD
jgi:hypothetical protein